MTVRYVLLPRLNDCQHTGLKIDSWTRDSLRPPRCDGSMNKKLLSTPSFESTYCSMPNLEIHRFLLNSDKRRDRARPRPRHSITSHCPLGWNSPTISCRPKSTSQVSMHTIRLANVGQSSIFLKEQPSPIPIAAREQIEIPRKRMGKWTFPWKRKVFVS